MIFSTCLNLRTLTFHLLSLLKICWNEENYIHVPNLYNKVGFHIQVLSYKKKISDSGLAFSWNQEWCESFKFNGMHLGAIKGW